jgi:serine/threonine protein kinase
MTPERWRQVTNIFHSALGRAEAEREAFLAGACGHDADLRRDVERMLAAHREVSALGETSLVPRLALLQAGASIGPYQIEHTLAAGGMGQVYKATDTRLGRTVAVKVLVAELATDPDFQSRFEREARTISRLEHHHICALYDVGSQDGLAYLVMQYLDGETLAARLERGALPVDEAIAIAAQVADALDAAHAAGIIHRDLKPANVFLTKSGVKLLDFGLAKSTAASAGPVPRKAGVTMPGMVLGTVPYMAPEQLEGKDTDARTDLFALGVVIYEMVTGRRPFDGEHQANVIASIMSSQPPPMSSVRPGVPATLERVVAACLAKDPDARWQAARDVKRALNWTLEPAAALTTVASPPSRGRRGLVLAGLVLLVSGAIVSFVLWPAAVSPDPTAAGSEFRFEVFPPEGASFAESPAFMSISPDGRYLAWHGPNAEGQTGIWVRAFDSSEARMLEGATGVQPFWSPDGRFIAFASAGKLKKIGVAGGLAQTLADSENLSGTWSQDDVIVFKQDRVGGLSRVSAAGGAVTPVTVLDASRGETNHYWPQFLPDGKHFLYQTGSNQPEHDGVVYAGSINSPSRVALLTADSHAMYVPPGYLLFMRANTLLAQGFDAKRLSLTGEPIPVAEGLQLNPGTRRGAFTASRTGVLAYRSVGETQLTWFDRNGKQLEPIAPSGRFVNPALSPDEHRLAATRIDPSTGVPQIWLIELGRGAVSRFTPPDSYGSDMALWSRDGSRIAFRSNRRMQYNMYLKAPNAGGAEELLFSTSTPSALTPLDWSADGSLIYTADDGTSRFSNDLWLLPMVGDRKPAPLVRTRFNESQAQLAPDGRWFAYVSDESGRKEIYVSAFPSGRDRLQVSTGGAVEPRWRADGKELFFVALDRSLTAVPVAAGPAVKIGPPIRLFQTGMRVTVSAPFTRNQYIVTGDGQRFLIVSQAGNIAPTSSITVMVNWPSALKRG